MWLMFHMNGPQAFGGNLAAMAVWRILHDLLLLHSPKMGWSLSTLVWIWNVFIAAIRDVFKGFQILVLLLISHPTTTTQLFIPTTISLPWVSSTTRATKHRPTIRYVCYTPQSFSPGYMANPSQVTKHKAELSHELIAGAAAFEVRSISASAKLSDHSNSLFTPTGC